MQHATYQGWPVLLDEFQARLARHPEQSFLAIPKMWMSWLLAELANFSWVIQGTAAHANAEASMDDLLLLASQPNDDGMAQVCYVAADTQDYFLVGTDDTDSALDVVNRITEHYRQQRIAWHPLSKQVLAL